MPAIYLDHAATTPVRDDVRDAMRPYLYGTFGNPSSPHRWGRAAAKGLWEARERVAGSLGCLPTEIYFTSGGTESDNLAVVGACRRLGEVDGRKPVVAMTAIEHHAVLDSGKQAVERGEAEAPAVLLGVSAQGRLDEERLSRVLMSGPCVVSVMWVNNETGMKLPLAEVAYRLREANGSRSKRAILHTDAVQAVGKIAISLDEVPVDLLSLTGHKIYGPKGTGALFIRKGVQVAPLLAGGGQERGLRPGTEDVAGAVGLSVAVELAERERKTVCARMSSFRDRLEGELASRFPQVTINCSEADRIASVSSVHVSGRNGQALVFGLDMEGVACSGGSACSSGSGGSHVIDALYPGRGGATLRFSLGRTTTPEEIDATVESFAKVMDRGR